MSILGINDTQIKHNKETWSERWIETADDQGKGSCGSRGAQNGNTCWTSLAEICLF